jgi:hypothetical protein
MEGEYFVFMYENKTMKSVKIVLRKRGRGKKAKDRGVTLIKIYYKHSCKCYNVPPVQL